ncbi:MAG: PqqD family protein [Oscillospiraceae bacterium]|jgi:hypothetical protein
MNQEDMDVLDFAREISMKTVNTPISMEYDEKYGQKNGRWWSCQREHLVVWCLFQPTSGLSDFKHKPNHSARNMYNHFGRPETLLWLAEALGEDKNLLKSIVDKIKGKNRTEALKIIRENIPFERIMELL